VRLTGERIVGTKLPLTKDECNTIESLDLLDEAGKNGLV
jgi:hypothetical protein